MSTRVYLGVNRKTISRANVWHDSTEARYALRFDEIDSYGKENGEIATVRDLTAEELNDLRNLIDGVLPRQAPCNGHHLPNVAFNGTQVVGENV